MRMDSRQVLFVHAHPDDETIATGGTIATLIDAGVGVSVLTCTRGELGEVIPPELAHLEGDGPRLAEHRVGELAEAMRILGVDDHRYLGEADARLGDLPPRRYLDSGMVWGEAGPEPVADPDDEALCSAPLDEVVADIASVIADIQPSAVVSYDANGGYGHPDHIRTHQAAREAAGVMAVPFF
ncbi:MAG TPA: PIG-L family deacetylase, partial [Homoserinimonas sp.]|nr:PIG-L family deacetylase [Homoserinimonas sp.]